MFPRPPVEPERREPDRGLRPWDSEDVVGLVLFAGAGLAIWRLGFWWGIGLFVAGFLLLTLVEGINLASREGDEPIRKRRRRRGPILAQLHASGTGFLAGLLGFGAAAVIGAGVSGGAAGILAAATTNAVLDEGVGLLLDLDWTGAIGSWCLLMVVWLGVSVPLAAYIAPGYDADGVGANVGVTLLVWAANWLVVRASPWRWYWRQR